MSTKRRVILASVAVLAVTTAFFLWRRAPSRAAEVALPSPSSDMPESKPPAANVLTPPPAPEAEEHGSTLQRVFRTLNHNPIEFYGRALDQHDAPVTEAEVRGIVLINTGTLRGREKRVQTVTDQQGYFRFTGLQGQDLGMVIKKNGYEFNMKETSFSYSYFEADHKRHIPDPKNPVIFRLWKKQGAEKLVHYDREWRFPVNAGPVRINLETGKLDGPEADLIVTISRDPLRMPFGARGFAWQATVEVVGGGLLQAGERDYYNLAPESGYQPRLEDRQDPQNPTDYSVKWTWREKIEALFFVSSRGGKNFARINLRIWPNADHNEGDNLALVSAEVWLNSNGSRNLEFDPAKAIRPQP